MARKRKYKKRKGRGFGISQGMILTLVPVFLLLFSILLFASYTNNGSLLTYVNTYLIAFFGILAFLIPVNMLLFALLTFKMKNKLTSINVTIGFLSLTFFLMGLFRSGVIGQEIFLFIATFLGNIITYIILALGVFISMIILFNISVGQLFEYVKAIGASFGELFSQKIAPLFKTRKTLSLSEPEARPITIKGLKEDIVAPTKPAVELRPNLAGNGKRNNLSDELILNKPLEIGVWEYPPLSLLSHVQAQKADRGDVKKIASTIEKTLESFGIKAQVVEINVGPSVTQYALELALGTKVSKIMGLTNDLALATEAPTGQIRIEAPIPGRNLVGIEIPNRSLEVVPLRKMMESEKMIKAKSKLAVPLGLDVSGNAIVADLTKMPHVLIAGTTGSGKSVLVNTFISSILFRASPSEVKMILIDPKRVEMTAYRDIPHLLTQVVVEAEQSVSALKWALKEMDRRYIKFAEAGVRNIDSYNELAGFQAIPYITIVIDELADLMAVASVEVEDSIARLAQMARATGIHLVLATQRPSVDVITGLIKANIPCRIAFSVSSGIDSKVIIDGPGAEKLLGRGDMLYVPPDQAKPTRIQGTFITDQDTKRLVNFIKSRGIPVQYTTEVIEQEVHLKKGGSGGILGGGSERDELFGQAVRLVCQYDKASSSLIQRRFQVGFNRAARMLEQLEAAGVVGVADGSKPREVLIKNPDEFLARQGAK